MRLHHTVFKLWLCFFTLRYNCFLELTSGAEDRVPDFGYQPKSQLLPLKSENGI